MPGLFKYISIALILGLISSLSMAVPAQASAITISPVIGTVGSTVTIEGSGFPATSSFNLYFDSTFIDTLGSDSGGVLEVYDLTVPEKPAGSHTIKVSTTTRTFTIIPKIKLSGASAAPGASVSINGKGFNASDGNIQVVFDTTNVKTVTSDSNGSFASTNFSVPLVATGTHTVTVTDSDDNTAVASLTTTSLSIEAGAGANGSIFPSGIIQVDPGAAQTFSIQANPGYAIYNVDIDGHSIGIVSSYTFSNIDRNHTITASFSGNEKFLITLSEGWNILSTPVHLAAGKDTLAGIFDQESQDNIVVAYTCSGGHWNQVSSDFILTPLTAIYLKVAEDRTATAAFFASSEATAPPSRHLETGLNLIGPAPAFLNGVWQIQPLSQALASIIQAGSGLTGYTMVISPPYNQTGWTYAAGGQNQDLLPFHGYWVVMENPDTLYGFSTTPLLQPPGPTAVFNLKYASNIPVYFGMAKAISAWIAKIEANSQGRIKITEYWGSSLLTKENMLNGITEGIADIGWWTFSAQDQTPLNEYAKMPLLFKSWHQQNVVTRQMYQEFPDLRSELESRGAFIYAMRTQLPEVLHTSKVAVHTPDNVKGMKIAANSFAASFWAATGAAPVAMGPGDWYTSIEKGLIGGLSLDWDTLSRFGLISTCKYHTGWGAAGISTSTYGQIINLQVWNTLPANLQKVIMDLEPWLNDACDAADQATLEAGTTAATALGNTIINLTDAEIEKWYPARDIVIHKWLNDMGALSLPGQQILDRCRELVETTPP
jgi:TRAP-type C4-dicarboxylate transport system substrate-binding protein